MNQTHLKQMDWFDGGSRLESDAQIIYRAVMVGRSKGAAQGSKELSGALQKFISAHRAPKWMNLSRFSGDQKWGAPAALNCPLWEQKRSLRVADPSEWHRSQNDSRYLRHRLWVAVDKIMRWKGPNQAENSRIENMRRNAFHLVIAPARQWWHYICSASREALMSEISACWPAATGTQCVQRVFFWKHIFSLR